ncbi:MAG: hypothetical protein ACYTAQ_11410, partial [Planctomycetota bacterium]
RILTGKANAMLMDIVIGCMLVVLTTVVHAAAMVAALQGFRITHAKRWARASHVTRVTVVASLVLVMFLATLVEAGMWAATYLALGAGHAGGPAAAVLV